MKNGGDTCRTCCVCGKRSRKVRWYGEPLFRVPVQASDGALPAWTSYSRFWNERPHDQRREAVSIRLECPAWGVTMAPQEPHPRVEGAQALVPQKMVESGVCPGQWHGRAGSLHHGQCTGVSSTTQRRVARNAILCERTLESEAGH
jgi:hypothetical protein